MLLILFLIAISVAKYSQLNNGYEIRYIDINDETPMRVDSESFEKAFPDYTIDTISSIYIDELYRYIMSKDTSSCAKPDVRMKIIPLNANAPIISIGFNYVQIEHIVIPKDSIIDMYVGKIYKLLSNEFE